MLGADDVAGGGGDDTLIEPDAVGNRLDGGAGSDQHLRRRAPTAARRAGRRPALAGREGDDVIDGGDGDDCSTRDGPDAARSDADRLAGGPGTDLVTYTSACRAFAPHRRRPGDGAPLEGDDIARRRRAAGRHPRRRRAHRRPGPDELDGRGGRDVLDGGAGDDRLLGGGDDTADDTLTGGPGADALDGGPGGDRLAGGDGADTLDGGRRRRPRRRRGADALAGGEGDDRLDGGPAPTASAAARAPTPRSTRGRAGPVEVTLDGVANDGEVTPTGDGRLRTVEGARSEGDDVDATTENATGGGADDTLGGDAEPNTIAGDAGEDVLTGGGGADALSGGARSDAILARDGAADRVSCGAGYDYVLADARDRIAAGAALRVRRRRHPHAPRARRDVAVDPRCARGADAEISPPDTARAVPLGSARWCRSARASTASTAPSGSPWPPPGPRAAATLGAGSGEMRVTQRRAARGDVRTELRASDCPRASASGAGAHARASRSVATGAATGGSRSRSPCASTP